MSYREADLKSELKKALEEAGHICIKLPDLARGVQKECDLLCGIGGRLVAVETKLRKTGAPLAPAEWKATRVIGRQEDLRPGQHSTLAKIEAAGNLAFMVLGLYDRGDHRRSAWAMPYHIFTRRERWTIADCRAYGDVRELTWARGQGWDVVGLEELAR